MKQKLDVLHVFQMSWKIFQTNFSALLWLYIFLFALALLQSAVIYIFSLLGIDTFLPNFILNSFFVVTSIFISSLITKAALDLIDGKKIKIQQLSKLNFSVAEYAWASLFLWLGWVVGLLLLIVPGVYWMTRFFPVMFLTIDRRMDLHDAIGASLKLTSKNEKELFWITFITLVLNFAGLTAFGLGLLFTLPLTFIAQVYTYKILRDNYYHSSKEK